MTDLGPRTPARAILLDALGTLIALRPPWPALVRGLDDRFGLRISLEEAERALRREMAFYREHTVEGRDAAGVASLRRRSAAVLREGLPPQLGGVSLEDLEEALLAALSFAPYPDVVGALRELRARDRRLIVVSNWDVSLHEVLARIGLTDMVDGVVCSAEIGAAKPDPAIFAAALELAGVRASEAIHVGDSAEEDVAGARAAGIAAVLLRRGDGGGAGVVGAPRGRGEAASGGEREADGTAVIASLDELAPLVA